MVQAEQILVTYFHSSRIVFLSILQLIRGSDLGCKESNSLDWLEITFQ